MAGGRFELMQQRLRVGGRDITLVVPRDVDAIMQMYIDAGATPRRIRSACQIRPSLHDGDGASCRWCSVVASVYIAQHLTRRTKRWQHGGLHPCLPMLVQHTVHGGRRLKGPHASFDHAGTSDAVPPTKVVMCASRS